MQALSRMLGLANAFANKNDQMNGCGMLRTCCPLLSSKDILIAQQSINGGAGQEMHGYMHSFRQPQRPPMGPIHSPMPPPQIQTMTSYPSLPIPVMPQLSGQPQPQTYPMLASNIQYGSNVYQMPPTNQVNFNRQLNRKSLERNQHATYNSYNNNFQSKATYGHLLKQFGQSTVYQGKCGIKPTQFNQARVQNLHYPASSTEFGK